ncbi:MAG TPA: efflux RND transporter periplasmic adaptor subunit [Bryobacteraceae bacterium]|nr:efflux RND transporter periplasmic adaptor subunit [Bryobacteraceae bacterium]
MARASLEDLTRDLTLTAEFKPFQEVEVMAKVAGYVKKIYVDAGDRVQQGQLLASLEIPEMGDEMVKATAGVARSAAQAAHARDEIRRAEAAHQMTHLSYERLQAVMKQRPGLIAQQEIDGARSKDLVSEAQVSSAKSNLSAAAEQVSFNTAEQNKTKTLFQYTRVTAPFSGVITRRYADTGSMIQAGTASQTQAMPLVRLSENSLLRLILPVPESAVPGIHVGQEVAVHVAALDRDFPGKVARFTGKVQSATRTMDTEVDVPNKNLVLIPGMYAEVKLMLDKHPQALAIPVSAVDPDAGDSQAVQRAGRVLVVTSANRLESRKISLGLETANYVEVQSGLTKGDLVVIGNRAGLEPGSLVRPKLTTLSATKEGQ